MKQSKHKFQNNKKNFLKINIHEVFKKNPYPNFHHRPFKQLMKHFNAQFSPAGNSSRSLTPTSKHKNSLVPVSGKCLIY